jgi:hypothetical protein
MHRSGRKSLSVALWAVCIFSLVPTLAQDPKHANPEGSTYSAIRGKKPPQELIDLLQRQVGWDDARPNALNPQGLRLRFEKIDEKPFQGKRFARFRVYADGAPEEMAYLLGTWPIGKELSMETRTVYINERGLLMIRKPRPEEEMRLKVDDEAELDLMPLTEIGEPTRVALASLDRKLVIPGTVVPQPAIAQDGDCKLEVRMALPGSLGVLIIADGFPPKTKIPLLSVSEGEAIDGLLATNADGHAVTLDFPQVEGKSQGVLRVTAQGKGCSPTVEMPWGEAGRPDTEPKV